MTLKVLQLLQASFTKDRVDTNN